MTVKCFEFLDYSGCIPFPELTEAEQGIALIVVLAVVAGVVMSRRQIR